MRRTRRPGGRIDTAETLRLLHRRLAREPPRGLSITTVGLDESEAAVREFFGGEVPPELGYHHDHDHLAAKAFGVDVLPEAFLVVDGHLAARFPGGRDWNSRGMRRLLERLASEQRSDAP